MKIQPDLYRVKITDSTLFSYDGKSLAEFNKKQEKFKGLSFLQLTEFEESEYSISVIESNDVIVSSSQMVEMNVRNIKFDVTQEINTDVDITEQLVKLAEKPIRLVQENGSSTTYNNKCEVHMPGHTMLLYNEVLLKEDCCTDDLQSSLNSGWRLIAACPQPNNRRPDYILGRFNPELDVIGSAAR